MTTSKIHIINNREEVNTHVLKALSAAEYKSHSNDCIVFDLGTSLCINFLQYKSAHSVGSCETRVGFSSDKHPRCIAVK